jgi:hypothetical protein
MGRLQLRRIAFKDAAAFVAAHHRRRQPEDIFSLSDALREGALVGVVMGAETTPSPPRSIWLERAARTGDRAHLPADLARALIAETPGLRAILPRRAPRS